MEHLSSRMKKLSKNLNIGFNNFQDNKSDKFYSQDKDSDFSSNHYDGLKKHISDIEKEFKVQKY